jgi:hypothetical protein
MKKGTLFDSSRYVRFISDRDKVLERINHNTQTDVSRILFEALSQIEGVVSYIALNSEKNFLAAISSAQELESRTLNIFSHIIYPIVKRIQKMRRASFILSALAELEAIGQATKKRLNSSENHLKDFKDKITQVEHKTTLSDEDLTERVWLSLMRLRSKILDHYRLAVIQKKTPKEIVTQVQKAFPNIVAYSRPPRELPKLKEAAQPLTDKEEISLDFIDQADWDLVQSAYKETELPVSRFDEQGPTFDEEKGYMAYDWEMTQEMTDDFVKQVRDGQIDAAESLGIEEFVWVAILDDRTDDCCAERNGLTTSEIEEKLESGELDADECDATSAPAHRNCRCQMAPVASTDEVEGPDWKSFGEWLDS